MNDATHDQLQDVLADLASAQAAVDAAFGTLDAALGEESNCLKLAAAKAAGDSDADTARRLYEAAASVEELRKDVSRLRPCKGADPKPLESEFRVDSGPHPDFSARLTLARASLLAAAAPVLRIRSARKSGTARITFVDGEIAFDFGESAFTCPASGNWPGAAIVPTKFLFAWLLHPDRSDPVNIRIENRDFHLNLFHTNCHWQPDQES